MSSMTSDLLKVILGALLAVSACNNPPEVALEDQEHEEDAVTGEIQADMNDGDSRRLDDPAPSIHGVAAPACDVTCSSDDGSQTCCCMYPEKCVRGQFMCWCQ